MENNANTYLFYRFIADTEMINSIEEVRFNRVCDIDFEMLSKLIKSKTKVNSDFLLVSNDVPDEPQYYHYYINIFFLCCIMKNPSLNNKNISDLLIYNYMMCSDSATSGLLNTSILNEENEELVENFNMLNQNLAEINTALFSSVMYKYNKAMFFNTYYQAIATFENRNTRNYQFKILNGENDSDEQDYTIYEGEIDELSFSFYLHFVQAKAIVDYNEINQKVLTNNKIEKFEVKVNEYIFKSTVIEYLRKIVLPIAIFNH